MVPLSVRFSSFLEGDNLGVFSGLSPFFYVAISIQVLFLGWNLRSGRSPSTINLLTVLLPQAAILAVGFLVGGLGSSSSDVTDFMYYYAVIQHVVHNGLGSIVLSSGQAGWWPSATAFHAVLFVVTGLTGNQIVPALVVSRIIYGLFDTTLVFVAVRAFKPATNALPVCAALLYAVGDYFVPAWLQDTAFSYTLFLVLIVYLIFLKRNGPSKIAVTIIFGAFVLSNLYASVLLLGLVGVDFLIRRDTVTLALYLLVLMAWNVLGYPLLYGGSAGAYFISNLLNFHIISSTVSGALMQGSNAHHLVVLIQVGLVAFFTLGGIAGVLFSRFRNGKDYSVPISTLLLYAGGVTIVGILAAPGFGNNPIEGLERAFIFVFPLLAIMFATLFRYKSLPILLAIAIVLVPVTIITTYGGVVPTYVSSQGFVAANFLQNHWANNKQIALTFPSYGPTGGPVAFTNGTIILDLVQLNLNYSQIMQLPYTTAGPPRVGVFSQTLETNSAVYAEGGATYLDFESKMYDRVDLVYSNPGTSYYIL